MPTLVGEPLTPREAEVLAAVERRLGNAEIAAELVLSVRTVESHIAALRRKLGADSRTGLVEAARARRGTGVPVPRNSFVGRDDDVRVLRELLATYGWVTVAGPAGCGKTRLALELAAADARAPVVVELEHAVAADVGTVVARAVGVGADSTNDPASACGLALAAQPYLLVLDNCDRVTDGVRALVPRLLAAAPGLRVLATSRTPAGGPDEVVHPLEPLALGDGARLFLDRARTAAPGTEVADLREVHRICRRLDGLPLAVELAAARVRHLTLPELAARLEAGLGPLDRAGPEGRHRTLEAAFEWSWDLLDDSERAVLSRLAALPRTFDLDLADVVAGDGAADVVLRLLDRSLVTPTTRLSDPRRFRLLAPLRSFVLGRADAGVVADVRRLHATHHAALAGHLHARARTDDSRAAAEQAHRLCPEVNAALRWALPADPPMAVRLARALSVGGEQFGPDIESLGAISQAVRDPLVREVVRPEDLVEIGLALCYGDLDLVAELAGMALDRADGDEAALAAEHLAGYSDAYGHRPESALAHLDRAEQLAVEQEQVWALASVRQGRGVVLRQLGRYDEAMTAFQQAMDDYALAGDAMHVNNARHMMAATAAESRSHVDEALVWVDQCAAYALESGNRHEHAHAELTRARLIGRPADGALTAAARVFRSVGDLRCLTRCHLMLADALPPAAAVAELEAALLVASTARDAAHQEAALAGLVGAHWAAGAQRQAAVALGRLAALVGSDRANEACPEDMRDQLATWSAAVAEGRARGVPAARASAT